MTDYIIVGGGTAGCVLAARLSEDPDHSVLLLEAGDRDHHPEIHIPATFSRLFQTDADWNYHTEPQAGAANRALYWPRGKVLGGSSSINLCNYIRCHPDDLNGWKLRGWSFREMLGYFRRAEALDTAASADGRESPATPRSPHDAPIAVGDIRAPHAISLAFVAGLGRWLGRRVMAPMLQVLRVTTA